MTTHADTRIQTAIEDSIRERRIVTLTAPIDTQEWVDLTTGLSERAADWTDANPSETAPDRREYWGEDEDGDEWRVHLDGSGEPSDD